MKLYYQWTQRNPEDWGKPIDSSQWPQLAALAKPEPVGGEKIDNDPGWLFQLCIQGLRFNCFDHYHVEPFGDGVRVTTWNDDPEQWLGNFYAQVWTMLPLAPDPKFGGAINTHQSFALYAQDMEKSPNGVPWPNDGEMHPWSEFVPPTQNVLHGIQASKQLAGKHWEAVTKRGWREWAEDIPEEYLKDGMVAQQRSLGLWAKARGTLTYYQRDTDRAYGVDVFENEDALEETTDTPATEVVDVAQAETVYKGWSFASPANKPNSSDWPSGDYRIQYDISAKESGSYIGQSDFIRANSDISARSETLGNDPDDLSTTGLHTHSVNHDPDAGLATDRFAVECYLGNTEAHKAQEITLELNTTDSFADGPWSAVGYIEPGAVNGVASVANVEVGTPRVTLQSVAGVASLVNMIVGTPLVTLQAVAGVASLPNLVVATPASMILEAIAGIANLTNVIVRTPLILQAVNGIASLTNMVVGTPRVTLQSISGIANLPNVVIETGVALLELQGVSGVASLPNVMVEAEFSPLILQEVAGIAALLNVEVATPQLLTLQPISGIASLANVEITAAEEELRRAIMWLLLRMVAKK